MLQIKCFFLPFLLCICSVATGQTISTIAGVFVSYGYGGDGGPATAAKLGNPVQAVTDGAGNVYIADFSNFRIRKINTAGVITTVAGIGTYAHSGDGGPATAAGISYPRSLAIDGLGNLYICEVADSLGSWVRKVDAAGIITTIAGNGTQGFGGDGGPASAAIFDYAIGLAADVAGNLYIADINNHRIRKIDTSGMITTITGNGTPGNSGDGGDATAAELNAPFAIAVDDIGNVYISDPGNINVRKVSAAGIITTLAGDSIAGYSGDGGPATAAELRTPMGVAVDVDGNVYIADAENTRIREINTSGIITTVAGDGWAGYGGDGGPATAAELDMPQGVAVDVAGNMYIADFRVSVIRKVAASLLGVNKPQYLPPALTVSPNPNQGSFTLLLSSPINENTQVTISNVLGEKIKECTVATNKETAIQVSVAGIYFLTAVSGDGVVSGKVVVR
jgi:hypothetical protein